MRTISAKLINSYSNTMSRESKWTMTTVHRGDSIKSRQRRRKSPSPRLGRKKEERPRPQTRRKKRFTVKEWRIFAAGRRVAVAAAAANLRFVAKSSRGTCNGSLTGIMRRLPLVDLLLLYTPALLYTNSRRATVKPIRLARIYKYKGA